MIRRKDYAESSSAAVPMFKGMKPMRDLVNILLLMCCLMPLIASSSLHLHHEDQQQLHPNHQQEHRDQLVGAAGAATTSFSQHPFHHSATNAHPSEIPSRGILHAESSATAFRTSSSPLLPVGSKRECVLGLHYLQLQTCSVSFPVS